MSMEKFLSECRFTGGSAPSDMKPKGEISGKLSSMPSKSLSRGRAEAVKSGVNASAMAKGRAMGRSPGPNPAREIAKGAADARRYATGGHISNRAIGMKELAEAQSRNEKLNRVGHKRGGRVRHAEGGRESPRAHRSGGGDFWDGFKSGFGGVFKNVGHLFGLAEGGQPPMGPSGRRNPNVMYKEGGEPKKRGGSAKREHHMFGMGVGNFPGGPIAGGPLGMGMRNAAKAVQMAAQPGQQPQQQKQQMYKEGGQLPLKKGGRAHGREHHSWGMLASALAPMAVQGLGKLFGLAEGGQPPRRSRGGNVSATSMVKKLHSPLEKEPQMKALGATKKSVQEAEPRHYRARGGSMVAMYEKLHGHQATEPQMKILGATKANTKDGLPHRASRRGRR